MGKIMEKVCGLSQNGWAVDREQTSNFGWPNPSSSLPALISFQHLSFPRHTRNSTRGYMNMISVFH